jgi:opacity protein-like surface antigen
MKRVLFAVLGVMLALASPARAQDKPIHVNLGGGVTMPLSDVKERFGTGGQFNIGVVFEPTPTFGVGVEYSYNALAGKDATINLFPTPNAITPSGTGIIESHHNMQYISFNGMLRPSGDSNIKPYFTGGAGFYYRSVSLTTPSVGYTTYCDPYWYVCYPALVEVDRIIGDRSSWDPGINLGAGVNVKIGDAASFYVETRWHYMWGPEFTNGTGEKVKANGQYMPITFGFRF